MFPLIHLILRLKLKNFNPKIQSSPKNSYSNLSFLLFYPFVYMPLIQTYLIKVLQDLMLMKFLKYPIQHQMQKLKKHIGNFH